MSRRYAEDTSVPVDRSRTEIERTLIRFGASMFAYATDPTGSRIAFEHAGRRIVLSLPYPGSGGLTQLQHEQAIRAAWRALVLVIKAKLVAVDAGVATFEDEFLAYTALPDGSVFGDWARPQIARAYELNTMPALLPGSAA